MELENPKYLYLLIIIPIIILLSFYNLYWKKKKKQEFGDLELIKKLSSEASTFKFLLKASAACLGLLGLILALVNPKIGTKIETINHKGIDIVFCVDVSKSMLCEDIAPNRLEKSKQIINQIITKIGGDRIGIVAYAGNAFPVLPITTDYGVAKMFLQSMNTDMISSVGTSFDQAINLSCTYFDNKKTSKLLIMISDGEDHFEGGKVAAEKAASLGVKIIAIGIGTQKGGPIPIRQNGVVERFKTDRNNEVVVTKLNSENLQAIAKITKGGYISGNNTKETVEFVNSVLKNFEKVDFEETQQLSSFQSQFQWFLGFGFFFFFLDIFLLERKTLWIKKMNLFNEKT